MSQENTNPLGVIYHDKYDPGHPRLTGDYKYLKWRLYPATLKQLGIMAASFVVGGWVGSVLSNGLRGTGQVQYIMSFTILGCMLGLFAADYFIARYEAKNNPEYACIISLHAGHGSTADKHNIEYQGGRYLKVRLVSICGIIVATLVISAGAAWNVPFLPSFIAALIISATTTRIYNRSH